MLFRSLQSNGWVLKNFVNDNTNPGTVATWASLSETVRCYLAGDRNGLTMNAKGFALGYDSNPRLTASTALVSGAGNAQLRIQNDNAWYDVGPANSSWVHNRTSASNGFYWYQYGQNESSWRAPIFYDSDNTSYYVNPAGDSVMNRIGLNGASPANYLQIGSVGSTGYGGNHIAIGDGTYAYAEYLNGANYMAYYTTTAYYYFTGRYMVVDGSVRSPYFYDKNDTSYYILGSGA